MYKDHKVKHLEPRPDTEPMPKPEYTDAQKEDIRLGHNKVQRELIAALGYDKDEAANMEDIIILVDAYSSGFKNEEHTDKQAVQIQIDIEEKILSGDIKGAVQKAKENLPGYDWPPEEQQILLANAA